ncbi:hypothetical protein IFM89_018218 [Coptis chinensis]|uniref:Transcriptional coactivator p15 (PC4) C-terminal domain-containing protein n=1 Tax=Coptis chinensis TaxID=261450 RepID=A0A835HZE6_9MAGN|nr:hypothetical protein IFM89_018218 [Coptis chinensis]
MSWRGKRKDTNYSKEEKNPKRNFSSSSSSSAAAADDSDDIIACEISKNRRVTVRSWQGKPVIDIREFYVKDGNTLPGKKGISLSMDQWQILRDHMDAIDEAVADNT